ncbi:MAG: hypothetical protein IT350_10850 [Deltaproteobacteria bacterium]|nr:hypothetical protein [Deltaproteobacteria bacterium]
MLDAMLEGCVPIVRRTHNGRTAWVPLHSAHARADRETLKAALREALEFTEYFREEDTDGSSGRELFVVNVTGSAPPHSGSRSAVYAIMNEILGEDQPLRDRVRVRLLNRMMQFRRRRGLPMRMGGDPLPPPVPEPPPDPIPPAGDPGWPTEEFVPFLRPSQTPWARFDLLHPPWYLGFLRDTEIRIRIPSILNGRSVRGRVVFGPKGPNQPALEFEIHAEGTGFTYLQGARYYPVTDPPNGVLTIPIAQLNENFLPVIGDDIFNHVIMRDPERRTRPTEGMLAVWHAEQWGKALIVRRTIDDVRGSFINPDSFRDVSIELYGADHSGAAMIIESVAIQLNGDIILDNTYDTNMKVDDSNSLNLKNEISEFRKNLLLHDMPPNPANAPTYDAGEINRNRILQSAKNDVFTAWTRRNGMPWDKQDNSNEWRNQPDGWCTAFVAWHALQVYPDSGFPVGVDGSGRNWFHENRGDGLYIYPFAKNPRTGNMYQYEELGEIVQPGYGVFLRNWGHRNFFIYWLEPRRHRDIFTSAADVRRAVTDTHVPVSPRLPGRFDRWSAINWFRAIGGNQDGSRVTIGEYAIVNIAPQSVDIINDLREEGGRFRTTAVFWCANIRNEREIGHPDGFGILKDSIQDA